MGLCHSSDSLSVWDASVLWPNGLDDRVNFGTRFTHGNSNHVLGGSPNPFRGSVGQSVGRGHLNWPKICLRIDVQYIGNAA